MERPRPPRELLDFLQRYGPAVQSLTLALREVVHAELAPCHEYIFDMRSKVTLLYGATRHVIADGICGISVFRRHVILTFPYGADLNDPRGTLRGTGKSMRHIRVETLTDLDRPEIRVFLRRARRHAGLRAPNDDVPRDVVTRVKRKAMFRI